MANPEVSIERVTEYSDEVAAGIGKLMPDLSPNLTDNPIPEDTLRSIIESPDRDQLIAQMEGRVIGAATLNLIVGAGVGKRGWLEDFVVSEDENIRGKGVGYKLWLEMLDWCRERSVRKLELTSRPSRKRAHEFYERQGAEVHNTTVFYVDIE